MAGFKLPFGRDTAGQRASTRSDRKGDSSMKSRKSSAEKGVTLIAANTEVTGDVHFVNQLYINGHIQGNGSNLVSIWMNT